MKEVLELRPNGNGDGGTDIAACHRFRVFGMPFLTLEYAIGRKPRVASETHAHAG